MIANYEDLGSGDWKFKTPTLRNISITSPYVHDGRFETLEEVVEHYVSGIWSESEENSISFFTGDNVGNYVVITEGLSEDGEPIFGKYEFSVQKSE